MDIRRRIPDNLGGTDNLFENAPFIGSVEISDGIVAFGPAGLVMFLSEQLLPGSVSGLGFALAITTAVIGILLLFLKPNHFTLSQWVSVVVRHRRRNKDIRKRFDRSDGVSVTSDDDTRAKIGIDRIYPEFDAIEKPNGDLVGMIEIDGLNLYNATQEEVSQHISQYSNFLNTQLMQDFQLYLPMRQYDPTEKIQRLEDRLAEDEKVANSEFLRTYAEDRILWLSIMSDQAYTRDYYAILETTKAEVISQTTLQESGIANFLDNFGGPGQFLKDVWLGITGSATGRISRNELKNRQIKEHQRKLDKFQESFKQGTGSETSIVSGDELGVILKEFWEGIDVRENEKENFVREKPYVMGESDKEIAKREFENWKDENTDQSVPDNKRRW
jgi:hypothetical protein